MSHYDPGPVTVDSPARGLAPERVDARDGTAHRLGTIVVGVAVALVLLLSWSHISAPFGGSDEGINAAVWSLDSRALRELGPIDSAIGTMSSAVSGASYSPTKPPGASDGNPTRCVARSYTPNTTPIPVAPCDTDSRRN